VARGEGWLVQQPPGVRAVCLAAMAVEILHAIFTA
jgi:hypothetical protein